MLLIKPIAITVFAELYESNEVFLGKHAMVKHTLNSAVQLLATSEFCGDSVKVVGLDSSNVEVIYIGVDTDKFNPKNSFSTSHDLNIPENNSVILFLGRFEEDMGVDVVLECLDDWSQKYNNLVVLFVGAKGSYSNQLFSAQEKYPDMVRVIENAPFDKLPEYYSRCDFLLAPSKDKHPCMGVSIKESMSSGKPVIATRCGGIPEAIIDNETGYLIDIESDTSKANKTQLIRRVDELISNTELCKKLGNNARLRAVELFSSEACTKKCKVVFNKMLKGFTET